MTDPRAEDVVLEHRSYCSAKARERHFPGDVLGYVTPVSWAPGRPARAQAKAATGVCLLTGCSGACKGVL